MNDILEAINTRIKSPLFGYFITALVAINWKAIFFVLVDNGTVVARFAYFDANTSILSLLIYPITFAIIFSLTYPWATYSIMYLSVKPVDLKNSLHADSEHKLLMRKQELEEIRSQVLSNRERELIERAKRDSELGAIEDDTIRDELRQRLETLRKERDELISSLPEEPNYDEYKRLMDIAGDLRQRANSERNFDDKNKFIAQAREIESRAHKLIGGENNS